jgi:sugar/nucleoside kinase (ribokinase family)
VLSGLHGNTCSCLVTYVHLPTTHTTITHQPPRASGQPPHRWRIYAARLWLIGSRAAPLPNGDNTVAVAPQVAQEAGVPVVLDCGGVEGPIAAELLAATSILSPNESELARLTGMPTDTIEQVPPLSVVPSPSGCHCGPQYHSLYRLCQQITCTACAVRLDTVRACTAFL